MNFEPQNEQHRAGAPLTSMLLAAQFGAPFPLQSLAAPQSRTMATQQPVLMVHPGSGAEASVQPGGSMVQTSETNQEKQSSLQDKDTGLQEEESFSEDPPPAADNSTSTPYDGLGNPGGTWPWKAIAEAATLEGP